VSFPAPGAAPRIPPFSTAPVTVSRALVDGGGQGSAPAAQEGGVNALPAVQEPASSPATQALPAVQDAGAGAAHAPDPGAKAEQLEETYEYVLDRLRRDLLVEREQSGHLLSDHP
jgi:hypothetical protein